MPKVVFTHKVKDVELWASKHAERVRAFASFGTDVVDYTSPNGDNTVSVTCDIFDMAAFEATMALPEVEAARESHGVIGPISMYVQSS